MIHACAGCTILRCFPTCSTHSEERIDMADELFDAIENHDVDRVAGLLARGADPNAPLEAPPHWRALEAAIEAVYYGAQPQLMARIVKMLVEHGADVEAWDADHHLNGLMAAVYWGNHDIARYLLESGSDPNVVNDTHETPLAMAVEAEDLEMARLLLAHGATATMDRSGGVGGITPLGRAALNLDVPMIRLLIEAGADLEALDVDAQLPRDYLPARDDTNGAAWDEAIELLAVGLPDRGSPPPGSA